VPAPFSQTRRSLASDTARSSLLVWLVAGGLLAAWTAWFLLGSVTVYEVSKRARLEARQVPHPVAALVPGKIVTNALLIGKTVRAGDVLVELDADAERLRLKEEEARLAAIAPRIASLREEIKARQRAREEDLGSAMASAEAAKSRNQEAAVALDFARDTERRLGRLNAVGTVSAVEFNRALAETRKLSASRDAATSDIRRAELEAQARAHQNDAQIESLRGSILALEGEVATTEATIARLEVEIEKHLVRASIAGRVGDLVPLPPGAYVGEGQRLATIVPAGDLIIAAEFSPSLTLGRVRPGQPGRLRLDAFPWAQYGTIPATVSRVATEIRDNLVRVEFAVAPDAAQSALVQHGLLGSVEVSVEEVSPASLVLRAAGLLLSGVGSDAVAEPAS
jgi:membrane fusion protein (multidrug efflux system)